MSAAKRASCPTSKRPSAALVTEVFKLLARKISAGEVEDIKRVLPPELRELWPADKAVAAAKQPLSQRAFEEAEAYYEGSVD